MCREFLGISPIGMYYYHQLYDEVCASRQKNGKEIAPLKSVVSVVPKK